MDDKRHIKLGETFEWRGKKFVTVKEGLGCNGCYGDGVVGFCADAPYCSKSRNDGEGYIFIQAPTELVTKVTRSSVRFCDEVFYLTRRDIELATALMRSMERNNG